MVPRDTAAAPLGIRISRDPASSALNTPAIPSTALSSPRNRLLRSLSSQMIQIKKNNLPSLLNVLNCNLILYVACMFTFKPIITHSYPDVTLAVF